VTASGCDSDSGVLSGVAARLFAWSISAIGFAANAPGMDVASSKRWAGTSGESGSGAGTSSGREFFNGGKVWRSGGGTQEVSRRAWVASTTRTIWFSFGSSHNALQLLCNEVRPPHEYSWAGNAISRRCSLRAVFPGSPAKASDLSPSFQRLRVAAKKPRNSQRVLHARRRVEQPSSEQPSSENAFWRAGPQFATRRRCAPLGGVTAIYRNESHLRTACYGAVLAGVRDAPGGVG